MHFEQSTNPESLREELARKGLEFIETEKFKKQIELFEESYGRPISINVTSVSTIPSINILDTENKGLLGHIYIDENKTINEVIAEMSNIRIIIENYKSVMKDVENKLRSEI